MNKESCKETSSSAHPPVEKKTQGGKQNVAGNVQRLGVRWGWSPTGEEPGREGFTGAVFFPPPSLA